MIWDDPIHKKNPARLLVNANFPTGMRDILRSAKNLKTRKRRAVYLTSRMEDVATLLNSFERYIDTAYCEYATNMGDWKQSNEIDEDYELERSDVWLATDLLVVLNVAIAAEKDKAVLLDVLIKRAHREKPTAVDALPAFMKRLKDECSIVKIE